MAARPRAIAASFNTRLNPAPRPQLLVWDVRKGSQGTGVLQFGATGPYHHALLSHIDLSAALAAAAAAQHGDAGGEGGSGGAGASGLRWASACAAGGSGAGWAGVPGVCGLGPVDQVLVDPGDPARLGLVMQVCVCAVNSCSRANRMGGRGPSACTAWLCWALLFMC